MADREKVLTLEGDLKKIYLRAARGRLYFIIMGKIPSGGYATIVDFSLSREEVEGLPLILTRRNRDYNAERKGKNSSDIGARKSLSMDKKKSNSK